MNTIKKLILITALAIFFAGMAFSQPVNSQKITVTSSSCKAQLLYHDAMKAMENAEIAKVNQLLREALNEDK
jgi:hypothetical protein